jgi:polyisoprenoid-binding protein YceI
MRFLPCPAAVLAVCLASVLQAGAQTRYSAQPAGTSVKIDGTSSMHDWQMEGSTIGGYIEFGPGVSLDKTQTTPVGMQGDKVAAKVRAIIPVSTIHSKADHLPGTMDDLMQQTMKADDFRTIEFTLTEMTFKGPHAAGQPFEFDTKGELVIAGKTNKVNFPVSIEPLDGGKIKVIGTAPVKMTDFGVTPPAPNFGLGMMKCGDAVTIKFDWTLKAKEKK